MYIMECPQPSLRLSPNPPTSVTAEEDVTQGHIPSSTANDTRSSVVQTPDFLDAAGPALSDPPTTNLTCKVCSECQKRTIREQLGDFIIFGSSAFHVDCFKCAKCFKRVSAEDNLLPLSDGSPICEGCVYKCDVCQLPVLGEAIMAGERCHHPLCFKCSTCKKVIDELVFACTGEAVYCMQCYNARRMKKI